MKVKELKLMPPGSTPIPPRPAPSIPAAEIEEQLMRLLESPLFSHSRRYPGFLRYVVDAALNGRQEQLKERAIGIDVFRRNPDYDLNTDPVVRVTAGEVRKRLAQYYYEPQNQEELRIELRPGSYIPEFKRNQEQPPDRGYRPAPLPDKAVIVEHDPVSVANSASSASSHGEGTQSTLARSTVTWWQWTLGVVLLAIAVPVVVHFATSRRSALDEFWQPALKGSAPVTIIVGSWGTQSPTSSSLSIGTHAEFVSPVAWGDTITVANLQQFLSEHSHPAVIQVSSQTSFSDLQRNTTVLVSAFDNPWTERLTTPLRFHFVSYDQKVFAIEDRDHTERTDWRINPNLPYASLTHDYAIIARFHDPTTDQMIVVAAGIGENGTIAAGQMLTNPQYFPFKHDASWNSGTRNIEAVIETEVIDGKSGPPRIVAVTTW